MRLTGVLCRGSRGYRRGATSGASGFEGFEKEKDDTEVPPFPLQRCVTGFPA